MIDKAVNTNNSTLIERVYDKDIFEYMIKNIKHSLVTDT